MSQVQYGSGGKKVRGQALAGLALTAFLLSACSHTPMPMADHAQTMKMGTKGTETLKSLKGRDFDIAFLSQMIAHHEAAVDMARKALALNAKPKTKEMAQKVIDAQTKEIAQMTGWLKEWFQAEPSSEQQNLVRDEMKAMMEMPIDSDRMFYEAMIPHHQGAIEMSELAASRSDKAELKSMAAQIIQDQKAEIEQYQQLLKTS